MTSALPGPALQASRAAITAALADPQFSTDVDESLEPGEIQEVDMQAQAEDIRTVFSDPTNFNVKVHYCLSVKLLGVLLTFLEAPSVFLLDTLV